MPKYMYNPGSKTLHIIGYCHISKVKSLPQEYKYFDTEKEAHEYAGEQIKPCMLCEREKEKILDKENR